MTDTTLIELSRTAPRTNALGALARRLVFARLATLRAGLLRIREGGEVLEFGAAGTGPEASVTVLDSAFYSELAFGGSVGAGESYMLGHWQTDDLTALMRLMLRNRHALDAMEAGLARLSAPLHRGRPARVAAGVRAVRQGSLVARPGCGARWIAILLLHRSRTMTTWNPLGSLRVSVLSGAALSPAAEISFRHRFVDRELPGSSWGQTAVADLDRDGRPDFITGRSRGEIVWYSIESVDRGFCYAARELGFGVYADPTTHVEHP